MRDIHETPDKHPLIVRIGVSITNIEGNSVLLDSIVEELAWHSLGIPQ